MTWNPELPPRAEVPRPQLMEWLIRQFRSISSWTISQPQPGYGGLVLSAPTAASLTLTNTMQKIAVFDAGLIPIPKGVEQDVTNNEILIVSPGVWSISAESSGDVVPSAANASRTIVAQIRNETAGAFTVMRAYSPIPRYGETYNFAMSSLFRATEVQFGTRYAIYAGTVEIGATVAVNSINRAEVSVARVG